MARNKRATPRRGRQSSKSAHKALAMQYPKVVDHIREVTLAAALPDALNLFEDVKRFLVLCATARSVPCVPTAAIDAGWHAFILNTAAYEHFCKKGLGKFIHHNPTRRIRNAGKKIHYTRSRAGHAFGFLSENWDLPRKPRRGAKRVLFGESRCASCMSK